MSAPLLAHTFLTRIPLPQPRGPVNGPQLARAMVWFPVVGLTVGLLAAAVRWAADPLGPWVATVAACAAVPLVTGGFHEDGLADTCDGLGPWQRERRLEVMRDSRIGTFGALALIYSVAARIALLAPLGMRAACVALVAGHVIGRWTALPLSRLCPPARPDGLGVVSAHLTIPMLLAGTALAAAIAGPALWYVSPWAAAAGSAAGVAVVGISAVAWRRSFGGITGDTLGATNQLAEIAVYAAALAPS